MAISATTGLSDAQHRVQLRRAVVASTVGTIIEAYDFLLYVQVAPLVFAKLYFPSSDPLVGTLQAFGIYAVGFVSRPVGAALFGHYGDRIGRKVTLIATLLLTGLSTFAVGFVPGYASIGIWGAVILTVVRFIQGVGIGGEWGGATLIAMEWAKTNAHRGFITSWPQWGGPAGLFLANVMVLLFSWISGDQFLDWGWRVPFWLSIVMVGIGDADLHPHHRGEARRARAGHRGAETASQARRIDSPGPDGSTGPILHLRRLYLHLRHDGVAKFAQPAAGRGDVRHSAVGGHHSARRALFRPLWPQADVPHWHRNDWGFHLCLLCAVEYGHSCRDFRRYYPVLYSARHGLWAAGSANR
jgi:hypothetical protein